MSQERSADNTLVMYSDYVYPFCYLGRHSLNQYQEKCDNDLEIDWRPFDLLHIVERDRPE